VNHFPWAVCKSCRIIFFLPRGTQAEECPTEALTGDKRLSRKCDSLQLPNGCTNS
jgi:LSD1 subclass zinc finger protein